MSTSDETIRYSVDQTRLDRWHYHSVANDSKRFVTINNATRDLARLLMQLAPPGRNLSLALTALEDVRMRANSAIAVEEKYYEKGENQTNGNA